MITNKTHLDLINSPVRSIKAKVEMYKGSILENTFSPEDKLVSFKVERVGEEKFFGFGVCQKINIKLIDLSRELNITTAHSFKVKFEAGVDTISPLPTFLVTEVHRDEKTNQLSVTAYDRIYFSKDHTAQEVDLLGYSLKQYAAMCATIIGATGLTVVNIGDASFDLTFTEGANIEGTESLREILNDVSEATQSIYYMDSNDALVFKRLSTGVSDLTIDKSKYIELKSRTNRRLTKLVSATELGDDLVAELPESGSTQIIKDNVFWDLRDDRATLLDNALLAVGGLTINQFDCKWRGNYLLEIGDKIELITKDNNSMSSYLLDDIIEYTGALIQTSKWKISEDQADHSNNPTSLGEVINQTVARVDKVNKEINLMVKDVADTKESVSQLKMDTGSINASVSNLEKNINDGLEGANGSIKELNEKVSATMTSEDVKLEIQRQMDDGVTQVSTTTGFTFDDKGLNVTKTDSEMSTHITEDGMTVQKGGQTMLTANNQGVDAVNLHATTYLIIGTNSRLEDYKGTDTACFWIGN